VSDLDVKSDLEAGYLSRILSEFTASGWCQEKSEADGRRPSRFG